MFRPIDQRVASRDESVLRYLLERRAATEPGRAFALFEDGKSWTHEELLDEVRSTAAGLQAAGVGQNDHVVCWMANGATALRYWFAINYIGAIFVPINTAYRGQLLADILANADARLMIAAAELVPWLRQIDDLGQIEAIAVVDLPTDETVTNIGPVRVLAAANLTGEQLQPLEHPIEPWDTVAILYTSGTTGPSKGVVVSYMQLYAMFGPTTMDFLGPDDRFLINMPLFHVGGTGLVLAMLIHGGSVAVVDSFSVRRFWPQIRNMQATVVFLLGVMATFIERELPRHDDRDHPLKKAYVVPSLDDVARFSDRFGVDVWSIYNMTELSSPLVTERNPQVPGTCGKPRAGVEVRLVDEHDIEVPVGDVGEIVVRTDAPWALNSGYYKRPEATAEAWRNGWFHTGDLARRDEEDNYFFVDRLKDSIRRRGENISSLEVERELVAHPAVREAAVVAVPSELSEDEVLAVIALEPGATLNPEELIDFLRPRMAYFMIPRFIRFVDELPKTPTAKTRKAVLRAESLAPGTWDREAAGVLVKREQRR